MPSNIKKASVNLGQTTRSMLQLLQNDFVPDSTNDVENPNTRKTTFYLYFQIFNGGDYSTYLEPKKLSVVKRSFDTFKLTSNPKCLRLRYSVARCSNCLHFYSLFNTTKYWKEWDYCRLPQISNKLWEKKGIVLCTDCLWLYEALEQIQNQNVSTLNIKYKNI